MGTSFIFQGLRGTWRGVMYLSSHSYCGHV
jgi:hypothetical protein